MTNLNINDFKIAYEDNATFKLEDTDGIVFEILKGKKWIDVESGNLRKKSLERYDIAKTMRVQNEKMKSYYNQSDEKIEKIRTSTLISGNKINSYDIYCEEDCIASFPLDKKNEAIKLLNEYNTNIHTGESINAYYMYV